MRTAPVVTAAVLLALPATAAAAGTRCGVVLSVDRARHTVQVVDGHHLVHAYRFRGRLGALHPGSRLVFTASGSSIMRVRHVSGSSRTVSFYGRVVRSTTRGLVVRLSDGQHVGFTPHQIRHRHPTPRVVRRHGIRAQLAAGAGSITLNVQGLESGVTVLITESVDGSGNVTITITLPPPAVPGVTGSQQVTGVVADVGQDALELDTADGSELRLHMAASTLAALNLNQCDTVAVTYHQDAELLIADSVQQTGTSTSGDCSGDGGSDDVVGTITAVSGSGLTVSTEDQGAMTFTVDSPDVTDGFVVGDVVDVSYDTLGDGTLDAGDVEYVEQDASGTVTAVSSGSLAVRGDGGQTETFTADPSQGIFDGVSVGDEVDVSFHQSAGQHVADVVDDQSTDAGSWSGGD
jgi:hypothetical protein